MDAEQEPEGPQPIRRLQESLINRIAAGEIIHRPASALKELIENSLDARSTSIRITVKDGGLKLLQIQDNGCGIRKEDLSILAERFTTSKISSFSDLNSLRTYGFRGEAIASISHVAHLSVITKTSSETCAWKAFYADGALAPAKPGQTVDPKPCAGNNGTTITAEDLFYNTPTRLAALRSSAEEYSRILDVVTRYAVHNPSVSFVCKKASSSTPDLSTPSCDDAKQTIRLLYGPTIVKDLLSVRFDAKGKTIIATSEDKGDEDIMEVDDDEDAILEKAKGKWMAEAHFTNPNYHSKKMVFLLFINHRLVESARIKRGVESVYSTALPKGFHPFVYLSLEIDPRAVDVNVHPTKREVHFLDEETIIERICDVIQQELVGKGGSREYHTQTLLTGSVLGNAPSGSSAQKRSRPSSQEEDDELQEKSPTRQESQEQKKMYSKDKVRISHKDRTLDAMFPVLNPTTQASPARKDDNGKGSSDMLPAVQLSSPVKIREISESDCFLTSVCNLRNGIRSSKHNSLTEIMQNHIFVGIVDLGRSQSLIQHATKLYLVNHSALAEELFYQLGVRQFGNISRLRLQPPAPIRKLLELSVKTEEAQWKEQGLNLTSIEVANRIEKRLMQHREMLNEYFSMKINEKGEVESLPLLLRGYIPNLEKLPLFLMRLGPQVNWNDEQECFSSFLRELAYFYTPEPLSIASTTDGMEDKEKLEKSERWQVQHVLFPCMKRYLLPPKSLLQRDVVQVASLPDLYRVFERC